MNIDNITRLPNKSFEDRKNEQIQSVSSGREPKTKKKVDLYTTVVNKKNEKK